MKTQDKLRTATIRMLLAAIQTEEVSGKQARELSDDEVIKVLARESRKRGEAAEIYTQNGRGELAATEHAEARIIDEYLPTPLTEGELADVADTAIAEVAEELGHRPSMKQMGLVMALIAQRRADPRLGERHDVLSLLVSARGESGEQLSDSEIRDDLITLVLAGHETTATTLAWAFDLLLHHPDALRRVRAEAVGGGEAFTTAVINETLRVRPPAPLTARVAAQPLTIGGYRVEAGTRIVVHIIAINRSAEVYEHPHEFRPERFLGTRPQTYAWVPFGGGVKRCLGANFSMRELITVLHVLLREGEFTAVDDEPERIVRRSIMLVPRRGTRVRFRPAR